MKNFIKPTELIFLILTVILYSCKKEEVATLTTTSITNITATSASSGGNITSDGGAEITVRGVCWGANINPTTSDSKTVDGNGAGQFTSDLTELAAGTPYHVRAYATNSGGTAYGADLSFTTLGEAPECITQPATNVTSSGATLNGTVNANDLTTTVTFEYGTSASYGQTITAIQSPVIGNNIINVNADISGLTSGTTYHYGVKSANSLGTAIGNDLTFTTVSVVPTLTTISVSNITTSSAFTGGNITADGGASIIARGVCWATTSNPTTEDSKTSDGPGTGSFTSKISCLSGATIYYVRAYATNSIGTAYGNQYSFTTELGPVFNPNLTYGLVSDIDGNCYKTIQIGNQIWMAENLKTTKYNDNTSIPNVTDINEWANLPLAEWVGEPGDSLPMVYVTSGAYCWYNNDANTYNSDYGILYNWGAVGTDKLCPDGWHVPTNNEWFAICSTIDIMGGTYGEELMETGTTHWNESSPLVGTNATGFTALPGGFRRSTGEFNFLGYRGYYWASNGRIYPGFKFAQNIFYSGSHTSTSKDLDSEREGRSVRCIKDNH
jgi:uncharacterized protein (TIGR02145 family)